MMKKLTAACVALVAFTGLSVAQVKVGVIVGTTGPGAGLGIPFKNTFAVLPRTLGGQPVEYIIRDDATDPTNAVKFARDLIVGDKVDLLIGSSTVTSSLAISDVAAQLKTPQIALAPVGAEVSRNPWMFGSVQPADLMMGAVAADMKANHVRTVGRGSGFARLLHDERDQGATKCSDWLGLPCSARAHVGDRAGSMND